MLNLLVCFVFVVHGLYVKIVVVGVAIVSASLYENEIPGGNSTTTGENVTKAGSAQFWFLFFLLVNFFVNPIICFSI